VNASQLRVGDAERDVAAERLARHFAAGRLTQLEYDERLSAAMSARTGGDLDRLFADLPLLPDQLLPARPSGGWGRAHRWPVAAVASAAALALIALAGFARLGTAMAAYPRRLSPRRFRTPGGPHVHAAHLVAGAFSAFAHVLSLLPVVAVILLAVWLIRRRGWR
jgi:hypothetical protein